MTAPTPPRENPIGGAVRDESAGHVAGASLTTDVLARSETQVFSPVPAPPTYGPLTNAQVLQGPAVAPLDRISLYSDVEFEQLIQEWAYGSVLPRYAHVAWAPGSGDRGRDVIGYDTLDLAHSAYDVYQCKHYDHPLAPAEMWVEFGKVCVYTFLGLQHGGYRMPRRYRFVAPQGVGPALLALLENPAELRRRLIEEWPDKCARSISSQEVFPLEGDLLRHVETFDFSIFGYEEPITLVEQIRGTPFYTRRFGGGLQQRRPAPPTPPAEPTNQETPYVAQLLKAYGEHLGRSITAVQDLDGETPLRQHFGRQREAFFRAESLREFERDTLADDSGFGELKDEIYHGVVDTCEAEHASGYARVIAVTGEARRLQLTRYALVDELHVEDRTGVCHHLANDDLLRWVPE